MASKAVYTTCVGVLHSCHVIISDIRHQTSDCVLPRFNKMIAIIFCIIFLTFFSLAICYQLLIPRCSTISGHRHIIKSAIVKQWESRRNGIFILHIKAYDHEESNDDDVDGSFILDMRQDGPQGPVGFCFESLRWISLYSLRG